MGRPWLSIVTPAYNGERQIGAMLDSVARETDGELEVIVVDDGSTDLTAEILNRFRDRLPLLVLLQEHTGNWISSTNLGMALAQGEFVCWLHQDDVWCPGRLKRIRELIDRSPDAAWYFHPSWFIGPDGRRLGQWRCPFAKHTALLSSDQIWEKLLVQCFVATCAPVFPTRLLPKLGPMDESLWYSADWDYWLRLSALGPGVYDPEPLTEFRLHAESQTARRISETDEVERQQRLVFERHLAAWQERNGDRDVEDLGRLSMAANVALARLAARQDVPWKSTLASAWRVMPWRWPRFLHDSRLIDRVLSRWSLRNEYRRDRIVGELDSPPAMDSAPSRLHSANVAASRAGVPNLQGAE